MKYVLFLFFFIMPVASAVQIDAGFQFQTRYSNISFSTAQDFVNLELGIDYIKFNNSLFQIIPYSSINITISTWNTTGDYHKTIIVSSAVHDNPTAFTMGDFPPNTLIQAQVDGVNSSRFISDNNGYISFTYNGWTGHQFDFFLGSAGRCEGVSSNINTAFTLFGVVLIFVALGGFIFSLRSLNAVLLMSSIVLVMVGGVLIYAGLFAVASLGVVVC